MKFKIAFYVHHHGFGHLMRTMAIIETLPEYEIIVMGSNLNFQTTPPPNVQVVHLPTDVPDDNDIHFREEGSPEIFHYAPLNVRGIRNRTALVTEVLSTAYPLILIVDVSVEITMLARLCGVPTVVMRQHGKRTDMPHLLAYQSAELLVAPYSRCLYDGEEDDAYAKTLFTGGFSKFDTSAESVKSIPNHIAVIVGGGGSSLTRAFMLSIAAACPDYTFHLLGNLTPVTDGPDNLKWHGHLEHPGQIIEGCGIVIGNTGHNTVMEVASMDKRFIGIPEQRPFDEQHAKAEMIKSRQGIYIVSAQELYRTDWKMLFQKLNLQIPDWKNVITTDALLNLKSAITGVGERMFAVSS